MLPRTEPRLTVMDRHLFAYGRFGLVAALMLVLAACGQRYGQAPVVNGATGERIDRTAPVVDRPGTVRVQSGDSLYRIANRYRVGLRAIIDANNLKPPYTIYPGQKLKLPVSGVHIAARGETVYQIAQRYGTEPGTLVRINRIAPPYRLVPGQRIVLPSGNSRVVADRTSASQSAPAPSVDTRARVSPNPATRPSATPPRAVLPPEWVVVKRAPSTSPDVKPPPPSRGGFIWPVSGRLLSKFGALGKGLQNDGINILARRGAPVRAIQNGVVAYSGNELRGFGNLLLIKHAGGWISAYAHNDKLLVRTGQNVTRGQVISHVGSSGSVDKPQLHFELRRENRAVDPERYLGRRTASLSR
jgi:murein DD-endopeptidase MepM/ murein hydrolase activator NlpD